MCDDLEEHNASAFRVISEVTGMKNGFIVWEG